ncbi:MAG: flavohemoglobin expression-modulating QEGLA motif protein [Magnetococcales bacterium]|nr:flavohemoglobin expression-modulating QEGLA motif protein [Magnetococcales bacterium]
MLQTDQNGQNVLPSPVVDPSLSARSALQEKGREKKSTRGGPSWKKEEREFLDKVGRELSKKGRIRTALPGWGRLHIDRALPFICLYRQPVGQGDLGMGDLLAGEASYLAVSGDKRSNRLASAILMKIVETIGPQFGAFLIVEIWSEPDRVVEEQSEVPTVESPDFQLYYQKNSDLSATIRTLEQSLMTLKFQDRRSRVTLHQARRMPGVHGLPPLALPSKVEGVDCAAIGLQIRPIFRSVGGVEKGEIFPILFRRFRRGLSRSIRKSLFRFIESQTSHQPPHFQALGPRALKKLVWEVDHRLAQVCDNFDYLFQVTPVNSHGAWLAFQKKGFQKDPEFIYRPLPCDTSELKRQLFQIPVEEVDDPALSFLFREKQEELDRVISLMGDRNTPRFLPESIQVFGQVDERLENLALTILERVSPRSKTPRSKPVTAQRLAQHAEEEIRHYRGLNPNFKVSAQIREDMPNGFLVSRGELYIGNKTKLPSHRVEALLQHEVGVHLLTWFNGQTQPFKLLSHGLAGYEELQEGLAVLAEYLVGGLVNSRIRILAARVLAVRALISGATFIDLFQLLHATHGFSRSVAFHVAMRVYRGGGLTKDLVYLRGLDWLLDYLGKGGDLEPLWIGKIGYRHIPFIQELRWRKVLDPAPLTPRFMHELKVRERMEKIRSGMGVIDLINS